MINLSLLCIFPVLFLTPISLASDDDDCEVKVKKITKPIALPDGLHWDAAQQALFYVGVLNNTIHKYDFEEKEHTQTTVGGQTSFIIPVEGTTDQFLVGIELSLSIVRWDGKDDSPATVIRVIEEVDQDVVPVSRLNEAKVDSRNRLYASTNARNDPSRTRLTGSLYRLDGDEIDKVESELNFSNGIAFDYVERAMYFVDTTGRTIRRYDYDVNTGDISNMRNVFDFAENNLGGIPIGMDIDTNGNLWIASQFNSSIINVNPKTGALIRTIPLKTRESVSVRFGGPDYDILFVSTSRMFVKDKDNKKGGAIFKITGLCVKGFPAFNYRLS